MKKGLIKVLIGIFAALIIGAIVFVSVKKPFRKITANELSLMLCEALEIETDTPFETFKEMGFVDEAITKNGDENLTVEEAYSLVSRVYMLNQNDATSLNYVSDNAKVSPSFKYDIAGIVGDRYVEKGKINPKSLAKYRNISEVVAKIQGTEITESGECSDKVTTGNFTIKQKDVILTDVAFEGTIIVSDVENASITLSDVSLGGKLIIMASSGTKVVLNDGTKVFRGIYIVGAGGSVVVESDGTADAKIFTKAESQITGNFNEITLLEGATVNFNGKVETVKVKEKGEFNISEGSFSLIYSQAQEAQITVGEKVTGTQLALSPESKGNKVNFSGTAEDISIEANDSLVNIKATAVITKLNIFVGSDNSTVLIEKRAKTGTVTNEEGSGAALIDNRTQWDGRR